MTIQKATNITWHSGAVTSADREKMLDQKGAVIWFTGLSGSGKSTLAHAVEEKLFQSGHLSYVLDGDNIRHGLNKNLGFSPSDREENIRRMADLMDHERRFVFIQYPVDKSAVFWRIKPLQLKSVQGI